MYHNPDEDGDGIGDYYFRRTIRNSTILIGTFGEWDRSYEDFDQKVYGVVEATPNRFESN